MSFGINFLVGSRVSTAKKKWLKKADPLSTEELQKNNGQFRPVTTKKAANLAVRIRYLSLQN